MARIIDVTFAVGADDIAAKEHQDLVQLNVGCQADLLGEAFSSRFSASTSKSFCSIILK
jgi:hypothetical protein